uniref:Uncharacterized protein n=1 Tax=Mucochytrium quahogii TaxID=96639 RepID=A0A7S2RXQ8_9STRA|mmetsp:Transcript_1028/g.1605  ORF Transcript_1028/g.1605 Transcript_1028/m.1605 type:complete len:400 (-) Transcript_1028:47-1246(-)
MTCSGDFECPGPLMCYQGPVDDTGSCGCRKNWGWDGDECGGLGKWNIFAIVCTGIMILLYVGVLSIAFKSVFDIRRYLPRGAYFGSTAVSIYFAALAATFGLVWQAFDLAVALSPDLHITRSRLVSTKKVHLLEETALESCLFFVAFFGIMTLLHTTRLWLEVVYNAKKLRRVRTTVIVLRRCVLVLEFAYTMSLILGAVEGPWAFWVFVAIPYSIIVVIFIVIGQNKVIRVTERAVRLQLSSYTPEHNSKAEQTLSTIKNVKWFIRWVVASTLLLCSSTVMVVLTSGYNSSIIGNSSTSISGHKSWQVAMRQLFHLSVFLYLLPSLLFSTRAMYNLVAVRLQIAELKKLAQEPVGSDSRCTSLAFDYSDALADAPVKGGSLKRPLTRQISLEHACETI